MRNFGSKLDTAAQLFLVFYSKLDSGFVYKDDTQISFYLEQYPLIVQPGWTNYHHSGNFERRCWRENMKFVTVLHHYIRRRRPVPI